MPTVNETLEQAKKAGRTVEPVLKFENVAIEYPKRGRVPAFRAAEDIDLEIYPGRDRRPGGGVRLGQDHARPRIRRPAPDQGGQAHGRRRTTSRMPTTTMLKPIRRKTGIVFQDPGSSLNPRMPIGQSIGEPLLLAEGIKGKELDKRVQELLTQVELPDQLPQPLPARALGRPAPARRHRPRPRPDARAARRGRADERARRLGAGAIPRPAARAPGAAAVRVPVRQPRPRGGRHPRPPDRGDAPG